MSVIRVNNTKGFTVMSNYHFQDKEISLKAKGLLGLMISLPSNWDYSVNGLVAIVKENKAAVQTELKELKIKNKFANVRRIIAVKGLYKNETFEMKLSVLEFWIKQKGIWKLWSRQSVSLK